MEQHRQITFETEETVVLREGAQVTVGICTGCDYQEVLMATPQAAGFLLGVSERHIFRLLEAGRVHFTEDIRVLVCLESVRSLEKEVAL